MAQSGVIAGRFQLGIRVDATDNRLQARSCTWRVDQVPKTWSFGEVQDLLENYAFHRNPGSRQGMAPPLHILARLYPQSDGLIQPVVAIPDGTHIELSTTTRRPEDANCKTEPQNSGISSPTAAIVGHVPKRAPAKWKHKLTDEFAEDEEMEAEQLKRQKLQGATPKAEPKLRPPRYTHGCQEGGVLGKWWKGRLIT